jgi:hypothetical protein
LLFIISYEKREDGFGYAEKHGRKYVLNVYAGRETGRPSRLPKIRAVKTYRSSGSEEVGLLELLKSSWCQALKPVAYRFMPATLHSFRILHVLRPAGRGTEFMGFYLVSSLLVGNIPALQTGKVRMALLQQSFQLILWLDTAFMRS